MELTHYETLSLLKQALDIVQGEGLVTHHTKWVEDTTALLLSVEGHL